MLKYSRIIKRMNVCVFPTFNEAQGKVILDLCCKIKQSLVLDVFHTHYI